MQERTLAVFDLDGTITRRDTLLPFIGGFLLRHPRRWWRLVLCLPPLLRYPFGYRDRGTLKGAIVHAALGGVTRDQLNPWIDTFVRRLLPGAIFAEALECIKAHQRSQAHLVLLSASPNLYVPAIAAALGFDQCICTELRWHGAGSDAVLDGALVSANRRGAEKTRCVAALLAEQQPLLSYAYGNSPADLDHLKLVSAGTYVNGPAAHVTALDNVRAVHWYRLCNLSADAAK